MILLAACVPEAAVDTLPKRVRRPVVPDAPVAPITGESKALEMDFAGGQNGAPFGMAFLIPPDTPATATATVLSDGSEGFVLSAEAPGDALVCSQSVRVIGAFTVTARQHVASIGAITQPWQGVQAEIRARTPEGALVEVPPSRYIPLHVVAAAGEWETWEAPVTVPAGASKIELCWRFVGTTGTVEVDRATIVTEGVPLPAPVPVVSAEWDLDEAGPMGAPDRFEFLIPPGTRKADLRIADLGDARGLRFEVGMPGDAVACTQSIGVSPGMLFAGRMRLRAISTDERIWTGLVAEMRTYDMIGGLASPPGVPFSTLRTWKEPTEWIDFEAAFAPPTGSVTGKFCFRFVESIGKLDVDWLSVGPG